jgi:type IV secretory pathway VirB3-like protein
MKSRFLRGQLRELPIAIGFICMGVLFFISTNIALGIIAGVFFLLCAAIIIEDYLLAQRGCRAQAVVVDFRSEEDNFFPIVEFQDRRGETRRVTTKTGRGVKSPPCGSRVVVI